MKTFTEGSPGSRRKRRLALAFVFLSLGIASPAWAEVLSEYYEVTVHGRPVPVYACRVSAMPFNQVWQGYQRPLDQTELAGFGCWDMSKPVKVVVQSQRHVQLPLYLETPTARIESERFPFGKLVARQAADGPLELEIDAAFRPFWSSAHWRAKIWQGLGTYPSDIRIHTDAPKATAEINGDELPVRREVRDGQAVWVLDPYARLPRARDRVGTNRLTQLSPRP